MALLDTLDFQLRLMGQEAVRQALAKLSVLAAGGQRVAGRFTVDADGGEKESEKYVSDDLIAARELARFGLNALKLSRGNPGKEGGGSGEPDLFDSSTNPWNLKKVE